MADLAGQRDRLQELRDWEAFVHQVGRDTLPLEPIRMPILSSWPASRIRQMQRILRLSQIYIRPANKKFKSKKWYDRVCTSNKGAYPLDNLVYPVVPA